MPETMARARGPEQTAARRGQPPRPSSRRPARLATTPTPPAAGLPAPVAELLRNPGPGEPLPLPVSQSLSAALRVDLTPLRVHADARAADAADLLSVRAFTYGTHVFLGAGERSSDVPLMAHEAVHAVQQQAGPTVQLFTHEPAEGLEAEAQHASATVAAGGTATVAGRAGGGRVQGWSLIPQFIKDAFWDLVEELAPEIGPILRKGIGDWLREQLGNALRSLFDTLMAPIRAIGGFIDGLITHFGNLLSWMREAFTKLASGDCTPISEAAERIQAVIAGLASPVIERVRAFLHKVGDFFTNLWNKVGAPVWDFLKSVGGAIWEKLSDFGAWIWDKTAPIRRALSRAWRWVKEKLGMGDDGPEGRGGIIQWLRDKLSEAWDWVAEKLAPFKKPLLVVIGILVAIPFMLSPAGPIIAIAAAAGGLVTGVRWIAQHLRRGASVVDQRGVLEGTIIPAIMRAVDAVSGALGRAAAFVTEKLNAAVGGLGNLVSAVGGSILSFAVGAVRWVAEKFQRLAEWARDKLTGLAGWFRRGLERLRRFLEPVLDVLRWFGEVIGDLWQIAKLALSRAWRAIPACIRNPIVDFLINRILKRIPLLSTLLEVPDVWAKIKDTALTALRQIFRDGDFAGALWTIFKFLLEVLKVPVELVKSIWAKAGAAIDLIRDRPLRFLKTFVSALWQGTKQFAAKALVHLAAGALDWFAGQLSEAGIAAPTEWSFASILKLVMAIAGITIEKVFAILTRKVGPAVIDRLRKVGSALTGAWRWVATLLSDGPAGLWKEIEQQIGKLRELLVGWLSGTLVTKALQKLVTMLTPVGLAINAVILVYDAIKTVVQYLARILAIIDRVFDTVGDLARGVYDAAANVFEEALAKALPVAIGFLANWFGLGGLGSRVREMIQKVQQKVEQALEWLADQAIRLGRSVLQALGVTPKEQPVTERPEVSALKSQALDEAVAKSKRLLSLDAFHTVLADVLAGYRAKGLKSLTAHVHDQVSMAFTLEAVASDPRGVILRWQDVFLPEQLTDETVTNLEQFFMRQGFETYAAVNVDGRLMGQYSNEAEHAEQHLIMSQDWQLALDEAHAIAEGLEKEKRPRNVPVMLLINRAPCHQCSDVLVREMNKLEARLTSGSLNRHVKFILAPTGTYEPTNQRERRRIAREIATELVTKEKLSIKQALKQAYKDERVPEPALDPNKTQFADLVTLEASGWDLRLLLARSQPTVYGQVLANAIPEVRRRVANQFDEIERVG